MTEIIGGWIVLSGFDSTGEDFVKLVCERCSTQMVFGVDWFDLLKANYYISNGCQECEVKVTDD